MLERVLAVRRIAGKEEELVDRYRPRAVRSLDVHDGIERDESDGEVRWMRRDAVLARAEDRVPAVDPQQRGASAGGLALVARRDAVAEIAAADALEEISP